MPTIEQYHGGQNRPSPEDIDFTPGELLGCVSGELGLRKFLTIGFMRPTRERRPAPARKRSAQRREQHSVARFVARASDLSAQDAELVT